MVLPVLGSLRGEALRNFVRNLFPGFYERGLSGNQALQELREAGLGYRRQEFLSDFRQGESRYSLETKVKFLREDAVPSERILSPEYHGVPDKYSFVFAASGVDPESGEAATQYYYYHRNTVDSRDRMETEARQWLQERSEQYGIDVESVTIVEGYINPIWSGNV